MELGNLTQEEITAWVPYGKDGKVLMQYIARRKLEEIKKLATVNEWHNHRMVERIDIVKQNQLLGEASVKDWKKLTVGGKPFPFSPENRDLFMEKSYEFSDFVNLVCVEMGCFIEEKKEESKKKSKGAQSGS